MPAKGPVLALRDLEIAHDPPGKAEHPAMPGQVHQLDLATLPGFETHRCAGGDVQAHAATGVAVERQRVVGFEKVVMRADLDWPVATVGHLEAEGAPASVELCLLYTSDAADE